MNRFLNNEPLPPFGGRLVCYGLARIALGLFYVAVMGEKVISALIDIYIVRIDACQEYFEMVVVVGFFSVLVVSGLCMWIGLTLLVSSWLIPLGYLSPHLIHVLVLLFLVSLTGWLGAKLHLCTIERFQ